MNQAQAVLLTYWRRVTVGWTPVLLVLVALLAIAQMVFGRKMPAGLIWMPFYLTAPIAIHVKQQVVQVRDRILPAAMGVHLAVGLALIFLGGVLMPMVGMFADWHWCWGYPGLCVAIAGATFAGFATQAKWLLPLFFMAPIVGQFEVVRNWVIALWNGELESSGVLLLLMGIGAFAFAIYWLLTATEEDRGYHLRLATRNADFYKRDAVETEQSEALKEYWRGRGWFSSHEPSYRNMSHWREWARGSLLQQLKLWEFGRGLGMLMRTAVIFPLMMLIMPAVMGGRLPVLNSMMSPFLLFPGYLVLQMRLQQKAIWTAEILRPISRERFYLLAFLGTALSTLIVWAVMFFIITGGIMILSPAGVTSDWVLQFALVSGIGQLWVFSLGVWFMRYRSRLWMFACFMLPMLSFPLWQTKLMQGGGIEIGTLAVVTAVSCLLCAGILLDAYRRWLRVEIG